MIQRDSRATVSACLIVRDEEARLPGCLATIGFCDEVVLVDSGSRDRTVQIAQAAGARVEERPWSGFAAQRNAAIDLAGCDWILEIDADERVSPTLQRAIVEFLEQTPPGVELAALPLLNDFIGRPLRHSARYPDYRHRLFKRGAYRHDEARTVHEGMVPRGPVQPLDGDLHHRLADSLGEFVADARSYARLEGAQARLPERPAYVLKGIAARPLAKIGYRLLVLDGWRDGWRGAVRVGVEALSDAAVWVHALRRPSQNREAGAGEGLHFGLAAGERRQGTPRIVALAIGEAASARAADWLERARDAGADCALITDSPPPRGTTRVRELADARSSSIARAIDAEHQLRELDAVLVVGRRGRRLARMVPRSGSATLAIGPADEPVAVCDRILRELR